MAPLAGTAGEIERSGFIAIEARLFTQTQQYVTQSDENAYSLIAQPEFRYSLNDQRFTFIPYIRADSVDSERSHFDVRELYWSFRSTDLETLVGLNKVFWGVMESRHLIDIVNQIDLVEDLDGEEKLGQPMLQLSYLQDWGSIELYLLTGFRERTFPGQSGRLRTALPVDTSRVIYESSRKKSQIDSVIRYSHTLGDWDFGGYYFNGTSREPRFQLNNSFSQLIAVYDIINQLGIDAQYTQDAWLWKIEGLYREGQGNSFYAISAGFEYTLYQIISSSKDLGLLFEYHYDGRDSTAAPTIYDNDIFVAMRLAFNDLQDSSILAGVTLDSSGGDRFYNLEASRRIGEKFSAELKVRLFSHGQPNSIISAIEQDDYVQLLVRYYL